MYNQQKSNLIEKTITLASVEQSETQIKITDEANNFYSFFINKKTGGLTQAAQDLQGFRQGDSVNVVYEERSGSQGGTFRNVARIKPAGGQVTTTSAPAAFTPPANVPSPFQPASTAPVPAYNSNPTSLPRDLSITAQAFAKSLLESHQATPQDLVNPQWWSTIIFPAIHAMVQGGSASAPVEDISVEDIPFN